MKHKMRYALGWITAGAAGLFLIIYALSKPWTTFEFLAIIGFLLFLIAALAIAGFFIFCFLVAPFKTFGAKKPRGKK